jgi:GT2 family glycosyltransferase
VLQAVERDEGQYDDRRPVFWATGACMMVRSACYDAEGGLPASFFAHQEEIDFCWRLQSAGGTVWVEPASVVYHVGGGTLSADNPRKTCLNFRNNLTMLYRNLPPGRMARIVALRLILDGLSAFVFLLQGKPKLFAAVWRAHRDFFRSRKTEKPIRRALQRGHRIVPTQIYKGSIVWRYFTGRKRSPVK